MCLKKVAVVAFEVCPVVAALCLTPSPPSPPPYFEVFCRIYSMAKCHGCTLVINQSYWFEILQTIIKSFEGWGQVIIFLLLELTTLVFSVSISSVYKSLLRGCIHCILPWSICLFCGPYLFGIFTTLLTKRLTYM